MAAVESQCRIKKTAELKQTVYFKDVLTFDWKPEYVYILGKKICFSFQRRRKAMETIKIDKD